MKKVIKIITVLCLLLLIAHQLFSTEKKKVLARIGEIEITQGYLDSLIEAIPPQYKARMATLEGKKQLLEQIVAVKLFSKEASRLQIDKKPKVKANIESLTEQLLASEYVKHLQSQIKIGEDELKQYYEKNRSEFQQPEQIRARHILVKTAEDAKAIKRELKKGKDFAQLAKEKSTGPSGERGGDLDWFGRGRMDPQFEKAAFNLKKGEVSDIVHTRFGYHIIKLDDRKKAKQKTFDEAKNQIEMKLQRQRVNEKIEETKIRLKKEMKVEIFNEALE